ncbi:extracellular solute-binding protein [Yoonia sp. 208BN28-4]|uniref:extracellular solute-binding protein n=1 Tax=Yoonia sp. 208BN28-4 TaxID=3126505 RepID=UPI0030B67B98
MTFRFSLTLAATLAATTALAETTISHGYSAFGDLKYPADFTHFDYANPDAPQGGTIAQRQLYGTPTFDSLNVFIVKGDSAPEVAIHVYDSLMVAASDEPDAIYGLLAETIEYPEDQSYVIFNMRPEARFQDGEPVTADDVVFTIDALKTEGHPFYRNLLADVESVTAETDHRVRVDFAEGAGGSILGTVGELAILPRHFYDSVDFADTWMDTPLGSGPYVVTQADPSRTIKFCRDPDYWGNDLAVNAGKHNFECFAYEYFADDTVGLEAFTVGEYTMRVENRSSNWATAYDFPAAEAGYVQKLMILDGRPANAQGIWFNMRNEVFQDIRVRRAMELAFNFQWTNETLFYGTYNRTDSFFENTEMQATGMAEGAELALLEPFRDQLPESVFTQPAYEPYAGVSTPRDRSALREASRLLDEAGWEVGDDGMRRNAAGEVLSLDFPGSSRSLERILVPFTENLQSIGVDVAYDIIDPAAFSERRNVWDFDMTLVGWGVPTTPGATMRAFYGSAAAASDGSNNLTGIADPVVDALIEEIVQAESREALFTATRALDRVLRDRVIWIGNWYLGAHRTAVWDIFGMPDEPAIYDFNRGVEFWWLDQDKYQTLIDAGALPDTFR